MRRVDCMKVAEKTMTQIKRGAFLTVKSSEDINIIAIGWATVGCIWAKPIMIVAVRPSRHTFKIIEVGEDFTVSVPLSDMEKEIAFCGTKSGRDYDKFKECNLQILDGQKVYTPVIKIPGLHYECKIVYKSAMDPAQLNEQYDAKFYQAKDYHSMYFGEIVDCYETDQ